MKKFILSVLTYFLISSVSFAKEPINIAYTIDNNYVIPTIISIDSIITTSKSDTKYNFYIVESGLTNHSKNLMRNHITKNNHNVEFIPVDTDKITKGVSLYKYLTPIAIARVVIPEILPNVDRIIYLDGDTLITGDLSKLYNSDLGSKTTGMVKDIDEDLCLNKFDFVEFKNGYYNSGMILMDAKKWREQNLSQNIVNTLHKNLEKYQKTQFADQIIISEVLASGIKPLHKRWNNQCYSTICITDFDMKNGGIYHYILDKPWNKLVDLEQTPLNLTYINYWKNSEFKNYIYYYLWKVVIKAHKSRNSLDMIKLKYTRYFEVLKKNKKFPEFPVAEWDYIMNNRNVTVL